MQGREVGGRKEGRAETSVSVCEIRFERLVLKLVGYALALAGRKIQWKISTGRKQIAEMDENRKMKNIFKARVFSSNHPPFGENNKPGSPSYNKPETKSLCCNTKP